MLYAAYCRVSSEEQQKDETIDAQIDILKAYFAKNNITIPAERWYLDDGVGGEPILRERPEGSRLLLDAVDGKFTHLVIVRVNRIARDDYAAQEAFHTLKKMGVLLISLSEPFNYFEPSGQMMATVFSSFAAYDRATIKQNFADGKARKARRGKLPQGTIPYGYQIDKDMVVEVNNEQAKTIKLIYKLYIEDGMSLRKITEYLSSMGIPSPADYKGNWYQNNRKGRWCEYTVNKILRHDMYSNGVYMFKPPGQEVIPVPVPVIIEPETYFKARQAAKERQSVYLATDRVRNYLLSGMVECAVCGSTYVGSSNSNGRFAYYRCTKKKDVSCKNSNINADLLETIVWEDLCKTFKNPENLIEEVSREMEAESKNLDNIIQEIKNIDERISEINQERKRLLNSYAKKIFTENEINEAMTEREESLDTLQQRKTFLEQQLQMQVNQEEVLNTVAEIVNEIKDIPEEADDELKKDLIKIFIDKIEIHPGKKVRLLYRFGSDLYSECHLVK